VEHAHSVDRPFSWRGAALAIALLLVIALAGLGGMALVRRLGGTRPVSDTGHVRKSSAVSLHPRSNISVLVLNGNGVNGAAGDVATRLLARGYRHAVPTDAQSHTYARSVVLFRRGWESEASRLAHDAGIRVVTPLDGRLPVADARDQLVVILGG
jgi:hypothetical protein